METLGPASPQLQLAQNSSVMHSGYERPSRSQSVRPASLATPIPNSPTLATPSQETPIQNNSTLAMPSRETPILNSHTLATPPQERPVPTKPVCSRPALIQGMHKFERDVDESTQRRFQEVLVRLAQPLATCLRESGHEYRPMAIRLIYLGRDEASVRPWVVVLCPKLVKKRAEKFFKQDMAKRVCQSDEPGRESFQVAVVSPPRPKTGESASFVKVAPTRHVYDGSAWCSSQVKAEHDGVSSFATMGGYVIVNTYDGEATAYGLTAGHILTQKDYDIPSSDRSSAGAIPSPHPSDSEDDDTIIPENNAQSRDRDLLECSLSSRVDTVWTDMKIAEVSFSNEAKDRDWALIEDIRTGHVDRSYSRAENPRTSFDNGGENTTMVLGTVGEQRFLQIGFDSVVGTDCTLSQTSSLIITPSGHNFVPVYTLVPDTARVLPDGVSGTWVTARPTGFVKSISVYGQVIADDMFGDVYMIPLRAIIDDIRSLMDAAVVRLPKSMKELSQILTSQSQRERTGLQSDTISRDHSGCATCRLSYSQLEHLKRHTHAHAIIPPSHFRAPTLIWTHGAGGTVSAGAVLNFCRGYSRSLPVLAFQGTMELQARIKGFHECIDQLDLKLNAGGTGNTLLLGGRSMGARAAVMAASEYLAKKDNSEAEAMAVQLILTSYPLGSEDYVINQEGSEDPVRNRELLDLPGTVKILFIVGGDDTMCPLNLLNHTRNMMAAKSKLIVVRGADHGMNVTPAHLTVDLGEQTGSWAARWVMGGFTDDMVYIGTEAH